MGAHQVKSEALEQQCDENLQVIETYWCNCLNCETPHRRSSLLPALERLDFTEVLERVAARPECARESGHQCGRGSLPLHDALEHKPPMDVVVALLEACPE